LQVLRVEGLVVAVAARWGIANSGVMMAIGATSRDLGVHLVREFHRFIPIYKYIDGELFGAFVRGGFGHHNR